MSEWLDYERERREERRCLNREFPFLQVVANRDACWMDFVPLGWQDTVFAPMFPRLKEIWDVLSFCIVDVKEKYGQLEIRVGAVEIENAKEEKAFNDLLETLSEIRANSRFYCPECGKRKRELETYCKECAEIIERERN